MKDARIYVRAPSEIAKEMKAIARRRKTTVTAIILKHLEDLVEAERKVRLVTSTVDSEQV